MAALAFGLIGAWAAPAVGLAASTGWAIGSYLGGAIFRPTVRIEGPRLQDTKVQTSTYGAAIPIVYGAMRVAGNVIDMSEIREHSTTKKQRGKGGGTKYTTYTYEADVAVGLCEGTIVGVRQIWANGELLYSIAEDATLETVIASNKMAEGFTVYTGTETQMPDATLEALHGAGNVPAYRGIAYVVFSTLWLEKYGNRLPNFEFEVVKAGAQPSVYEQVLATTPTASGIFATVGSVSFDDVSLIQFHKPQWTNSYLTNKVFVYEVRGMQSSKVGEYSSLCVDSNQIFGDADVSCYATVMTGYLDPVGENGMRFYTGKTGGVAHFLTPKPILAAAGSSFCRRGKTVYVVSTDGASLYKATIGGAVDVIQSVSFGASGNLWLVESNGILYISRSSNSTVYTYDAATLVPIGTIAMPAGINTSATTIMCRDAATGALYLLSSQFTIHKLAGAAWELVVPVWVKSPLAHQTPPFDDSNFPQPFGVDDKSFFRVTANTSPGVGQTLGVLVTQSNILLSRATVPLGGIVQDLCARVGLTAIDKTALDSTPVAGYVMGRQAAVRGAIEPLQSAYFFDAVESGGLLKFVKRGGSPVASLPLDDLCAGIDQADSGDPLAVVRAQEVDLPQQVTISYSNLDAAYQTSAEIAQRIVTPSVNKVGAELPIAMTATQAARIADAWMYQAYAGRTSMKFKLSREYAALEPCDVVTVTDGVQTFTARITSKMDEGGVYAFEAENENGIKYNSNAQGAGNVPPINQVGLLQATNLQLIDTTLLRDEDNDTGQYAALSRASASGKWGGAVLLGGVSADAQLEMGSVTRSATAGVTTTVLSGTDYTDSDDPQGYGARNIGIYTIDESASVEVQLTGGELESISREQLLNLGNAAVIGSELLQFRDAVLIGDKKYRLSGFLRGRRGTEDLSKSGHAEGTRFILMSDADGILRADLGTLAIGQPMSYSAVTMGGSTAQADEISNTNTARGLKPYAPVAVAAQVQPSLDVAVQWRRRNRLDGGLRNSVDVPQSETALQFKLTIYGGRPAPMGEVLAPVNTQSITLSKADITQLFNQQGDPTDTRRLLRIEVQQISAIVGAGIPSIRFDLALPVGY